MGLKDESIKLELCEFQGSKESNKEPKAPILDQGNDDKTLKDLGIKHGDLISLSCGDKKTSKKRNTDSKESSKRNKKEKKQAEAEFPFYQNATADILAREILDDYNDRLENMASRAYFAQTASRRLDAVRINCVNFSNESSDQRITVHYRSDKAKKEHSEVISLYDIDLIQDAVASVFTLRQTSSRRAGSVDRKIFSLEELARRSPSIFWSLYYHQSKNFPGDPKVSDIRMQDLLNSFIAKATFIQFDST